MEKKLNYLDRFEKFYESYKEAKEEMEAEKTLTTDNSIEDEDLEDVEKLEDMDDMEELDEKNMFTRFVKGGSDEEIAEKAKKLEETLDKMVKAGKSKDYEIAFMDKAKDDKASEYDKEAAMKKMEDNNFLGSLKAVPKGDKLNIVYTPGKKGLAKLGTGTTSQTKGA